MKNSKFKKKEKKIHDKFQDIRKDRISQNLLRAIKNNKLFIVKPNRSK